MEIKKLLSNKGNILKGPLLINPTIFNDERVLFSKAGINHYLIDN